MFSGLIQGNGLIRILFEPQLWQDWGSNTFDQRVNLYSHVFCQGITHYDNLRVKFASLKIGIDEMLIVIDEVLIAKTSVGECSQEIHQ